MKNIILFSSLLIWPFLVDAQPTYKCRVSYLKEKANLKTGAMFCGEFDFDLATAVTRSYTFDQCPDFIVDFEAKKNGSTNQYFKIWKKTKSEITVSGLVPQKFSEDFNLIYTHPLTNRKSSLNEEVSLVCRK